MTIDTSALLALGMGWGGRENIPSGRGPDTDCGIGTTSDDPYTIECNSVNLPEMSRQDMEAFSCIRIPQLHAVRLPPRNNGSAKDQMMIRTHATGVVVTARDDLIARNFQASDGGRVSPKIMEHSPLFYIPDSDRRISTSSYAYRSTF